ncbi:MAG: MBL fold metallo-hydrolase [Candidatus Parcubacteria bacterium]|nr:MBL fold metallo-hydrolase [Candidatus Parcubacteria bacterium]
MSKKETILITLIVLNVFSWAVVWEINKEKGLEVCFFDVGQGDSIFIESPQGQQILIDGGPDNSVIKKLESRMPFWDRTIDLVVLTHPDNDHLFGLIEVLRRYEVKNILWTGVNSDSAIFKEWQKAVEKEGAKIWIAKQGLRIEMSKLQFFDTIYPFESLDNRTVNNLNDTSIVLMLDSNGERVLLPGDISTQVEKLLIEKNISIKADVLKVAHHGSKYSSSEDFIKTVDPDIAIISVGENNLYGHPSPDILARLEDFGINILQTSKQRNICLIQEKNKPFYLLSQTE